MSALQRANHYIERWGDPLADRDRSDGLYEARMIDACRSGVDPAMYRKCSTSERITLLLGIGRHDLLPDAYVDPVHAWNRLDERQRAIVRNAIGEAPWMHSYSGIDDGDRHSSIDDEVPF
jgi:hypothetical protein